jgi:hypothetical protein
MRGGASSPWLAVLRGNAAALWRTGTSAERGCASVATPLYQDAIGSLAGLDIPLVPALASLNEAFVFDGAGGLLLSDRYTAQFPAAERARAERAWQERRIPGEPERRALFQARVREVSRLVAAGGRVATASRSALLPAGFGLHAELGALTRAGLTPAQLLRAGTEGAAQALGLGAEVGRIAPGMLADMLVVDGDPLRDIRDLLKIETVILNGRPVSLAESPSPVPEAAEKFTPVSNTAPRDAGARPVQRERKSLRKSASRPQRARP